MRKRPSFRVERYGPAHFKTFASALDHFFADECPQLGGILTRQVIVRHIRNLIDQFYPSPVRLRPGQVCWLCVHRDQRPGRGRRIHHHQLTPVILDLVTEHDALDRANGKASRQQIAEAVVRLYQQAWEQDGVLSEADVAILLKVNHKTVGKHARRWEREHQTLLPRRGTVHDIGGAITHKPQICRKVILEGLTVEAVARMTYHSPQAVHRYIQCFKQIWLCRRKGMTIAETAFAVHHTEKLIKEYWKLIDEMQVMQPNQCSFLESDAPEDNFNE